MRSLTGKPPVDAPTGVGNPDNRLPIILIDLAIALYLFCCFGSTVAFVMKIQHLKEAPSWSLLIYAPTVLLTALAVAYRPQMALRTALVGGPFFLFILWTLASFQWSNQPDLTFRQGLLMCVTYGAACMISQYLSWLRLARVLACLFTFQAVISAGLAILTPQWGVMTEIYPGAWSGIWSFKQTLGVAMAVASGGVMGYALMQPKAAIWTVPALIIIVLCVFKSEATTAILVTGLAMAIPVAVWLAQRHPSAAVLSVWAVVTGLAALFLIVTILAPLVFQLLGKAPTLTGRTDIWRALAEPIAQRPWFGWGYQAFWTDTSLTSPVDRVESIMEGFRPPDAHSTPIDIRLQLGLVGLILVGLTFARTWLQILLQAGRQPAMMPAVGIFTAITAMAFTESIGLYPMDGMTLIVQLVVVKTALSAWDRRNSRPNKSQLG
ncbi:O-antigen ligase [Aquidulcibacter sp.]|uniref:O-antigen ligase family protein n=1 Tax=Aquidulcibacter sp. TaxID=2052990 RepID=UPI0028AF52C9|nr:O-antigen ligase [Aquidulcibacter sp.]